MRAPQTIIKRPLLTEKSTTLRETGGSDMMFDEDDEYAQKITFEVARDANKIEIRHAVQTLFNVQVTDVHTMIVRGKRKRQYTRRGLVQGREASYKKAIVTLRSGEIDLYEAV